MAPDSPSSWNWNTGVEAPPATIPAAGGVPEPRHRHQIGQQHHQRATGRSTTMTMPNGAGHRRADRPTAAAGGMVHQCRGHQQAQQHRPRLMRWHPQQRRSSCASPCPWSMPPADRRSPTAPPPSAAAVHRQHWCVLPARRCRWPGHERGPWSAGRRPGRCRWRLAAQPPFHDESGGGEADHDGVSTSACGSGSATGPSPTAPVRRWSQPGPSGR